MSNIFRLFIINRSQQYFQTNAGCVLQEEVNDYVLEDHEVSEFLFLYR
jgi:hypothetical protein